MPGDTVDLPLSIQRSPQISVGSPVGLVTLNPMPLKNPSRQRRNGPPPGETGQEPLYLRFLSEKQVPVTIRLRDGEAVYGWIEYFDDRMIRLTRDGKPNLFIYKNQIRTITESFRNIEARRRERNRSNRAQTNALPVPASPADSSQANGLQTGLVLAQHLAGPERMEISSPLPHSET